MNTSNQNNKRAVFTRKKGIYWIAFQTQFINRNTYVIRDVEVTIVFFRTPDARRAYKWKRFGHRFWVGLGPRVSNALLLFMRVQLFKALINHRVWKKDRWWFSNNYSWYVHCTDQRARVGTNLSGNRGDLNFFIINRIKLSLIGLNEDDIG